MNDNKYYVVKLVECSSCEGKGWMKQPISQYQVTCPRCHGEKVVPEYIPLLEVFGEYWVRGHRQGEAE